METLITVASVVLPLFAGIIAYFVRNIMSRIEKLEQSLDTAVTEQQVRQILTDKIDPVKEDMSDIKDNIKKLFDLYITKR